MSLSDKINGYDPITQLVVTNDIKEFIKELKEKIKKTMIKDGRDYWFNVIDKLAGDKLI